jgi:preprotein translocase YajC subunit
MHTNVTNDANFMLAFIAIVRFVLPLLTLVVACWLLLVIPQRRAAKRLAAYQQAFAVGAMVTTIDGRHGTICLVEPNRLIIQLTDGTKCQISPYEVAINSHGQI